MYGLCVSISMVRLVGFVGFDFKVMVVVCDFRLGLVGSCSLVWFSGIRHGVGLVVSGFRFRKCED